MRTPLYPRYGFALVKRSALIWFVLRGAMALLGELVIDPRVALLLVSVVSALVFLDAHVIRERTFHANLGLAAPWIAFVALLAAGTLELAAQVVTFASVRPRALVRSSLPRALGRHLAKSPFSKPHRFGLMRGGSRSSLAATVLGSRRS